VTSALRAGLRPGWLRCAACNRPLRRDPLCSDLAVLVLHWMSDHPARWLEMHPEDAWFLAPAGLSEATSDDGASTTTRQAGP
jgi:hypothetical protein